MTRYGSNNFIKDDRLKCELYNDNFENYKKYNIPKAQLIIADIPYNIGTNAYASRRDWYVNGKTKDGESDKANKNFFNRDVGFNIINFMAFVKRMLIKEPKEVGKAPALIVFCSWQQIDVLKKEAEKQGFKHCYPLVFTKSTSSQVLKANMRIVGATEFSLVIYRDKLPKFNNDGHMILDHMNWTRDSQTPKIHPTQKPIPILKRLIEIFTDPEDTVIDPVAGSATTLKAAAELHRNAYGFEVEKGMCDKAKEKILSNESMDLLSMIQKGHK